ncbi:hypothetical protein [Limnochorda pilosa]|uniref:Uncharacterized protein n=1 Tax=Limnochorda pilosa TaxID=1555112 RepID=A0A0K2SKT5_LIMPI|nr:hypothetical protein [Limnochorda pilosa]BAS27718.1 hypothetical protein LIP_1875 [Limnochorda pilosa]
MDGLIGPIGWAVQLLDALQGYEATSRERVRQWASDPRYEFPESHRRYGSAKLWYWYEVACWDEEKRGQMAGRESTAPR